MAREQDIMQINATLISLLICTQATSFLCTSGIKEDTIFFPYDI